MPANGHPERSSSSVYIWPLFERRIPVVSLCLPKLLSPKACFNIWCISAAVLPSLKQTCCSLRSAIAKPQTERNTTMEIHSLTINPTTQLYTPLATLIQEGCVGRHLLVFRWTHNHSRARAKFRELLDSPCLSNQQHCYMTDCENYLNIINVLKISPRRIIYVLPHPKGQCVLDWYMDLLTRDK
jgi:hypothetical protein